MQKSLGVALLGLFFAVPGCDKDPRVDALQRQLQDLDTKVKTIKGDVDTLKNESSTDTFMRNAEGIAYLTPGSGGFSVIKTDIGLITVSLDDIKPYANGSRVLLRFGNPTNATLIDISATLDWGSVDNNGTPLNAEEKSKDLSFNKPFRPGSWTTVDAVLDGVLPANLGFIRIHDLKNSKIELYK
jgi:hypothetical protein